MSRGGSSSSSSFIPAKLEQIAGAEPSPAPTASQVGYIWC